MSPKCRSRFSLLGCSLILAFVTACSGGDAGSAPVEGSAEALPAATGAAPGAPGAPAAAGAGGGEKVATVNSTPISAGELDSAVQAFVRRQSGGQPIPPEQQAQVRQMVLDALIGRELIYQHSVKSGIRPTEAEVDQAFAGIRGNFDTPEAWQGYLDAEGVNEAQARERVARNLAIDKVVQESVAAKVSVSDADIRKFYDENPQQMQHPEQVRASHILLRVEPSAAEAERDPIRARAAELLARAKQGGDFAALARENSQDPGSASRGGDLGFFARGQMVPSFDAAAFSLEVNAISDVVQTDFGYHIIKVTERRPAGIVPFGEVSERIGQFLRQQKSQAEVQAFVAGLRGAADVQIF